MRPDVHALAGAYALDALPADEQQRFERHLASCEACAEEVRGWPRRRRCSARRPPGPRRSGCAAGSWRRPAAPGSRPQPRRARRRRGRAGGRGRRAGAGRLPGGGPGAGRHRGRPAAADRRAGADRAGDGRGADRAGRRHRFGLARAGGHRHRGLLAGAGALVFSAHGLDRLEGEDYQLWLSDPGGGMRSAGVLAVGPDATAAPLLARDLGDAEGSRSPWSRPAAPTSPPVTR
ncbi:anti-sigma factor domain-containing protein [Nocardiopsis composta]